LIAHDPSHGRDDGIGPERNAPAFATPPRRARAVTIAAALAHAAALSGCASGEGEKIGRSTAALSGPILTQHNDNARTGANTTETVLTPSNVSPQQFGYLYNLPVQGNIYAQPLVASQVPMLPPGGRVGLVSSALYVATTHNMVYAFDVSGPTPTQPILTATLEPPVPNNEAALSNPKSGPQPEDKVIGACWPNNSQINIPGEIGIVSTPVIVGTTMYVMTTSGAEMNNRHYLHALDIETLTDLPNSPQVVTMPGEGDGSFPSWMHIQRAALLATGPSAAAPNGQIYASFAAYCDLGTYHGYVIGFDPTTLQATSVWNDSPTGNGGGIWQSGQGPAADTSGNVYLLTGNANGPNGPLADPNVADGGPNAAEAMVRLTPDLQFDPSDTTAWFVPHNYVALDQSDLDYSAGGVLLLPDTTLALGGGKYSTIYVTEQANLGGFSADDADPNVVQSLVVNKVTDTTASLPQIHGSPVYWNGPSGPYIYVWATNDTLKAFNFFDGQFEQYPVVAGAPPVGNPGGMLSLSANGNTNGIVWATRALCDASNTPQSGVFSPRQGRLMAFDANDVSPTLTGSVPGLRLLWDSASEAAAPAAPPFAFSKNAPPSIANGKVFVPTFSSQQAPDPGSDTAYVMVYGLMAVPPSEFDLSAGYPGYPATVLSTGGSLAASQQFGLSDNTDVFAIDNNGLLNVAWVTGQGQWMGPAEPTSNNAYPHPGIQFPPGAPVAASQQFGTSSPQTDVFAVDVNGNLDVAWVAGGGSWHGPSAIGAQCSNGQGGFFTHDGLPCQFPNDANIAVSQQFGTPSPQTDVFIVDSKGALTVTWWAVGNSVWQSAEITDQGLFPIGAPLAASQQFGLNQTDVFVVDNNGHLNVVWVDGDNAWHPPGLVGNGGNFPLRAYVAASAQFGVTNNTDVFAVDATGTLNVAWVNNDNPFNGPVQLIPPNFTPSAAGLFPPGAAVAASQQFGVDSTGQTDVFIVDNGGLLRVMWVEGQNSWQGPGTLGTGTAPGGFQPGASIAVSEQFGVDATGQTDVFVIDGRGNRTVTWAEGQNSFNGPAEIPSVTAEDLGVESAACKAYGQ
jgi:hypothetical protein